MTPIFYSKSGKVLVFSKYSINENAEITNLRTGGIITPADNHGYLTVRLYDDDGKCNTVGLHRLMASTFIGEPIDVKEYEADHIDNNRTNNHISNIQWLTHGDNVRKSAALRRRPKPQKEKKKRHYTEEYKKVISERMKGKKLSTEHKQHISEGHIGKHYGGKKCVYDSIEFPSKMLAYEYACQHGYTKSYPSFRREY